MMMTSSKYGSLVTVATGLAISLILSVSSTQDVTAFVVPSSSASSSPAFLLSKTTTTTTTSTSALWMAGEVTPKTIKQLRDATGAGMMDCKKALIEVDGDQEAAADYLRKKGLAKADKKASRVAAEGKIAVSKNIMVEVNCETDFVAKDGSFLGFCDQVAEAAVGIDNDSVEDLMAVKVAGDDTLENVRQGLVAKIGENIQVRRMVSRGGGDNTNTVGAYVHMNKIGVLVELEGGDESLCTDVAMHIAAMNPPYAIPEEVPSDVLDKEKRLLSEQALESGKPADIVEKMVEGTYFLGSWLVAPSGSWMLDAYLHIFV
jgi:elongation factor Ts